VSNTARITEKDTGIWTYTYDPTIGALTSVADPYGNTTIYEYNPQWQLYKVKDPRGNGIETVYTYDPNGNIATIDNPLDPLTSYVLNSVNKITSITYPENSWVSIAYDTDNSGSFTMTDPLGWNRYEYSPYYNLTKIIKSVDQNTTHTTTLSYENDYLKTITDLATSAATTFTYYPSGNLHTINDPLEHTTTFTYNGLNQITRITDHLGRMTDFSYDLNGNLNSKIDGNRNPPTVYQHNYKGQVTRITDALDQVTRLFYGTGCPSCGSGVDKLTSVIDAKGHTTSFEYDLAGRLVKETNHLGNYKTYTHDEAGNLETMTDEKNQTLVYTFDALNRLRKILYPDQTETNYNYDHQGNLTVASNPYIAYTFHYDARNRKDSQVTDMAGNIRSISYGFNGLNNRTQMTTPDNRLINYFYDLANSSYRINTIQGDYIVSHDLAGRRTALTFPNGAATTYGYNEVNYLTSLLTQKAPATINSFGYLPDAVGNRDRKSVV
jgi:YD repeat-containing protein